MEIKVSRVPGRTSTLELEDGATVQDAIDQAQVTVCTGEAFKLNGRTVELGTELNDGDKIIIAKGAKGNLSH